MTGIIAQEVKTMLPDFVIDNPVPSQIFSIAHREEQGPNITFNTSDKEMLKITPDGFYVRGVKVPQDEAEAEAVYKAFRQFLVWSALIRN